MNQISDDIILYKINNYLNLKEKLCLSLVNKEFSNLEKQIKWFHIGEIIASSLGINLETINSDMEIIRDIPFEIIKEIVDCLDCNYFRNKRKYNCGYYIPLGVIIKIHKADKKECIKKLKTENIFRNNRISKKIRCNSKNSLRKRFPNVYSMLD